ncbi:MAG: nucleotide exchange factor GrpE [Pseudomonadota bacterium]
MSDDHTPEETEAVAEAALDAIESLKAENAALKEQVLRYAAEAENIKRRAEREANDARAYAIQKFARDLLGAADNLSRATAAAPTASEDPAVKNFVLGVEMTEKALQSAFESNGLKRVDPERGEKFDPHKHQAMMEQPADDVAAGGVIQVLQTGYELFGRVVRPAMVVVAAKGSGASAASGDGGANPYAAGGADTSGASVDTKA